MNTIIIFLSTLIYPAKIKAYQVQEHTRIRSEKGSSQQKNSKISCGLSESYIWVPALAQKCFAFPCVCSIDANNSTSYYNC